ncbi:MAG TPA: methyltransferase type 11 [Candidatus Rokubacteria bacterium]|nr:methyltransferase type 11 [Candidatus Rokubacteria bacterium]
MGGSGRPPCPPDARSRPGTPGTALDHGHALPASEHREAILDQFTRQAVPFSTAPGIQDEEALRRVVEFAGAGPADTVLDVACGGGLIVCAFARVVRHATGIDITPAMLERARALAVERGLTNVSWRLGDVLPLPYPEASFSVVTSRYAFHHFLDPLAVLREMARVCAPGGRVVVVDSAPAAGKDAAFNRLEKLRDPSHVRALPLEELADLYRRADLGEPRTMSYRLDGELEALIGRSFPRPEDVPEIRRIFAAAVDDDAPDVRARRDGDTIRYGYPVAILAARRA